MYNSIQSSSVEVESTITSIFRRSVRRYYNFKLGCSKSFNELHLHFLFDWLHYFCNVFLCNEINSLNFKGNGNQLWSENSVNIPQTSNNVNIVAGKNGHHDHIPFNLKGNIVFSVYVNIALVACVVPASLHTQPCVWRVNLHSQL